MIRTPFLAAAALDVAIGYTATQRVFEVPEFRSIGCRKVGIKPTLSEVAEPVRLGSSKEEIRPARLPVRALGPADCHQWQEACLVGCMVTGSTSYRQERLTPAERKCIVPSSPDCSIVTCTRQNFSDTECSSTHRVADTFPTAKSCGPY